MATVFEDIGIVEQIVGQPVAVSPDGEQIPLAPGDSVKVGWKVITDETSSLTVQAPNGARFDIGRNSEFVLNEGEPADQLLLDIAADTDNATQADLLDAELIQALIAAGADPTAIAEATAAGPAAGGTSSAGSTGGSYTDLNGVTGLASTGFDTATGQSFSVGTSADGLNFPPVANDFELTFDEDQIFTDAETGAQLIPLFATPVATDANNPPEELTVTFTLPEGFGRFFLPDANDPEDALETGVELTLPFVDFQELLFNPFPNQNDIETGGPLTFDFTVTDPVGASDTGTLLVNLTPINDAPDIIVPGENPFVD
ncbi:MAG: retention module-containing protein, partial [Litorivicinus sp.]